MLMILFGITGKMVKWSRDDFVGRGFSGLKYY